MFQVNFVKIIIVVTHIMYDYGCGYGVAVLYETAIICTLYRLV